MEIKDKRSIFICSDLGGSDPDDYQSFVHMLFYTCDFNLAGFVAGYPRGKKTEAIKLLKAYEKDYPQLIKHRPSFPKPGVLIRDKMFQGSLGSFAATGTVSPGAKALVKSAHEHSRTWEELGYANKQLLVLCWGAATEVAQAIEFDPSIKSKIFCFMLGDWNVAQDRNAYQYLLRQHDLDLISCMSSHRGFYLPGINGLTKYDNVGFVKKVVAAKGHGYLAKQFIKYCAKTNINFGGLKMGDTPSLLWALTVPIDPVTRTPRPIEESWGGSYMRTSKGRWEDNAWNDKKIGVYKGAKTVSKYRGDALRDFEVRLSWAFK